MHVNDIINFDPKKPGQIFQGDVSIIPIPADIEISTTDEVAPINGRLVIQEGEATGHHHAIYLRERRFKPAMAEAIDPVLNVRDTRLRKAFGGSRARAGTARLFRDRNVVREMARRKVAAPNGNMVPILTRDDLALMVCVVEGGSVVVRHEEHGGIRLPAGRYLIGGQVESAGAEERKVVD